MKKSQAIRDYPRFSDAELLAKSHTVATSLTGNTAFPNTDAAVGELNSSNKLFEDAMAAAKGRSMVKVSEKNVVRKSVIAKLDGLRAYVNNTADGDRTKLLSSGFTVSKETSSSKELGEIKNFRVKLGRNSGEVKTQVKKVDNGKFCEFQFALSPVKNDEWKHVSTPGSSATIGGLERGKEYDFRVCIVGNKGVTVYSDVVTIMVV